MPASEDHRPDAENLTRLLEELTGHLAVIQDHVPTMEAARSFPTAEVIAAVRLVEERGRDIRRALAGQRTWETSDELRHLIANLDHATRWHALADELCEGRVTEPIADGLRDAAAEAIRMYAGIAQPSQLPEPAGQAGTDWMERFLALPADHRQALILEMNEITRSAVVVMWLSGLLTLGRDAWRRGTHGTAPDAEDPVLESTSSTRNELQHDSGEPLEESSEREAAFGDEAVSPMAVEPSDASIAEPARDVGIPTATLAAPDADPSTTDPEDEETDDPVTDTDAYLGEDWNIPQESSLPAPVGFSTRETGTFMAAGDAGQPASAILRTSHAVAEPLPLIEDLPAHLSSLADWAASHVVDPAGVGSPAPWTDTTFSTRVAKALTAALESGRWQDALCLIDAQKSLDCPDVLLSPEDFRSFCRLVTEPGSATPTTQGTSPLVDAWERHQSDPELLDHPGWRILAGLAALRPCLGDQRTSSGLVEQISGHFTFDPPQLGALVRSMIDVTIEGGDAVRSLSLSADRTPGETAGVVEAALASARMAVVKDAYTKRFAKDFEVPRKHSNDAWSKFFNWLDRSLLQQMKPERDGGAPEWDPDEADADIGRFMRKYTRYANHGGVRLSDRDRMDAKAAELLAIVEDCNAAMRAWRRWRDAPALTPGEAALYNAWLAMQEQSPPQRPIDAQVWTCIQNSVAHASGTAGSDQPAPLILPMAVDPDPVLGTYRSRYAASTLVSGAPVGPVDGDDEQGKLNPDLESEAIRLQGLSSELERLADPACGHLLEWSGEAFDGLQDGTPALKTALLTGLTRARISWAERRQESEVAKLLAPMSDAQRSRAEALLSEGRHEWLHMELRNMNADAFPLRDSMWRHAAETAYRPDDLQAQLQGENLDDLTQAWADQKIGPAGPFLDMVFDWTQASDRRKGSTFTGGKLNRYHVKASTVRNKLTNAGVKCLPQFCDGGFSGLVIAAVRGASSLTLDDTLHHLLKNASAAESTPVVLLVPGISPDQRLAMFNTLRSSPGKIAILDDIDLWRIIRVPRQFRLAATIEILLEQQKIDTRITPYSTADGQHVRPEMYIGREDDIGRILATNRYVTRLFSGRKLGKSALLRYIQQAVTRGRDYKGRKVLFVDIAGIRQPFMVVERIQQELLRAMGLTPADVPDLVLEEPASAQKKMEVAKRNLSLLINFWAERSKSSLLIALDEADRFIEQELEDYAKHKEDTLSWRMRSPPHSDRVRFLVAGYRVADTVEGAWANWGECLVLKPLDPKDAATLVSGPLARLGIDASDVAPMLAYRCGYQPVLLLKFGELLLNRLCDLREFMNRATGQPAKVSPEHVSAVFAHPEMKEAIRQVVRTNFQGDDKAAIIFQALLLEIQENGSPVTDPVDALVHRLGVLNGGAYWPHPEEDLASMEVRSAIGQFEKRYLISNLEEADADDPGDASEVPIRIALRFPHHLPVLLRRDLRARTQSAIRGFRAGDGMHPGLPLPKPLLDALHRRLQHPTPTHQARDTVVFASAAPSFITDDRDGALAQLGLGRHHRVRFASYDGPALRNNLPERFHRIAVVEDVPPEQAAPMRRQIFEDNLRPVLVGDVTLLRWALKECLENDQPEVFLMPEQRLSLPAVRWWLQVSKRQFAPPARVHEATSGIPMLIEAFLEQAPEEPEVQVSDAEVTAILDRVTDGLPSLIERRLSPLTEREWTILAMAIKASDAADLEPGDDISEWLRDMDWGAPALDVMDLVSVQLLQHLGLLPRTASASSGAMRLDRPDPQALQSIGAIGKDDAVRRIVATRAS